MRFRPDLFWRCARGGCPDCGAPGQLAGFATIRDRCSACGMVLRRREGFFLGAMVWNYGLTAFGLLPALLVLRAYDRVSVAAAVWLAVAVILLVPWLIHGFAWRLWLGTYYGFLPEQLPSSGRRLDD
ncbi:DUF983 domain-containing protein [bacterium]|jgi:uncharacterized protein (DUF983 family)|nr:DUF983 domain-containing protein [bacterium]